MTTNNIPTELATIASGRVILTTADFARAIGIQPQTARKWACYGNGPILPVKVGKRLGWRVADIAKLLNGGAER